jgi:hypothetical protein
VLSGINEIRKHRRKKARFHGTVHAVLVRIRGEVIISKHQRIKCILRNNIEEDRAPSTIEHGGLFEDEREREREREREKILDVDDGDNLKVKLSLRRILVLGDALIFRVSLSVGGVSSGESSLSLSDGGLGSNSRPPARLSQALVEDRRWTVASLMQREMRRGRRSWDDRGV